MEEELNDNQLEEVTGGTGHSYSGTGGNSIWVDDDCPICKAMKFKYNNGTKVNIKWECDGSSVIIERKACHNGNGKCEPYYLVNYNALHIGLFNRSIWYPEDSLEEE